MLSKKTIEAIAKMVKVDASDLEAKIKAEGDQDIELPELKVFTIDEFDSRLRNEKSSSYEEGKVAGEEMKVKKMKESKGYDFEGKNFEALLKHHEEKIKKESGTEPSKRIKELETDIENLNKVHKNKIEELMTANNGLNSKYMQAINSNALLSIMPDKTAIDKSDIITLFNANYKVENDESGKMVIKDNMGNVLKDQTTANPLELKQVFNEFLSEKNYILGNPGRGAGNELGSGHGTPKDLDAFNAQMEKESISSTSPEYRDKYAEWRKSLKEATEA